MWVRVEKYLLGEVTDLRGRPDPSIFLRLRDSGETVQISVTEDQLPEAEAHLNREVAVRVQAEQHLQSRELRHIRLLQFLPFSNLPCERALATLWQKGREAWRDVGSATAWVEELRGNK